MIHVPLGVDGLFKRGISGDISVTSHELPRDLPARIHNRQEAPHSHQIVIHGDEIIVPDLGSNVVWRLRYSDGQWETVRSVNGFEEGDGPRHAVLHPNGKSQHLQLDRYLLYQLDNLPHPRCDMSSVCLSFDDRI